MKAKLPNPKAANLKLRWLSNRLAVALFLVGVMAGGSVEAAVKGAKPAGTPNGTTLQSAGQVNAPEGTPTHEIQEIEKKMDAYDTRPNPSADIKANNAKIKRDILNGAFDLRELARLALDKHWGEISPAEQSNFVALLTDILETKAIFSKEQTKTQNKSYLVEYLGDQYSDNKTTAMVRTKVVVPKENVKIEIDYKLKKSGSGWRVFDIIVDDASLVKNYQYHFDEVISKKGYNELVSLMRKKLAEIKSSQ